MAIRPYRSEGPAVIDCIIAPQDLERGLDARMRPGQAIAERYLAGLLEKGLAG